jgi:succinate-acetate transporter protein
MIVFPRLGWCDPPDPLSKALYLFLWGVFTLVMFIGTLKLNRALQMVFASLALLFFLLALADVSGSESLLRVAGVEGIICGLSAVYAGLAQVLNEVYKKKVWPLGQLK